MQKSFKILISVYACSPNEGSEPGMGWNFVMELSNFHELHVIVEKRKWEHHIKNYIKKHPRLINRIKFYFIDKKRNKFLRKIWPPSYYWFYNFWQKEAFKLAKQLDNKENFDLVHQLNMVGYREPGYLWKINKPFIWGPIGGLENSPWRFLPSLGFKGFIFYSARNIINLWQRFFFIRPKKAAKRSNSILISATPNTLKLAKSIWGKDSHVICEIGCRENENINYNKRNDNEILKIAWSGLHTPRKNLPLLLRALEKVNFKFELHILGDGKQNFNWKKLAKKLKLNQSCIWYGWVDKELTNRVYRSTHICCITSISDLTSTVTLEALSMGLPIICLNHCGFSHVVNDSCGIKIDVSTPKKAAIDISNALIKINEDERFRRNLCQGALLRAKDFSWDSKINKLNSIYNDLLKFK
tara:strand:+ start:3865 stop:5103 length:1239 start_codon:yes stop_codon:yes gene_type:complete